MPKVSSSCCLSNRASSGICEDWEIVGSSPDKKESIARKSRKDLYPGSHVALGTTNETTTVTHVVTTLTGTTTNPQGRDLDVSSLDTFRQSFDAAGRIAQNAAATHHSVRSLTTSRALLQSSLSPYFSVNLDQGGMPVTDQKDSGRCWMFGTLNLFRFGTRDKLHLDDFEFSESYLLFYYLLEQVNFFLEFFLQTSQTDLDDRLLSNFLDNPVDDGGDWGIAVNLIQKYGLVPKDVYPESFSSSYTDELDAFLNQMVTHAAFEIRTTLNKGTTTTTTTNTKDNDDDKMEQARRIKWKCVAQCHRILTIHLGTPPMPNTSFDWHWRDMDGEFHVLSQITPQDFARNYVTVPYAHYVSLIQDPRNDYYQRYQVEYSMPICGGDPLIFLNIPACEMKAMALKMLQDGLPVFFACIVENELDEETGLWDANLYEKTQFYGVSMISMNKADRIRYGSSMGDHVMLFTGVDVSDDGTPRRWRVENSWGTEDAGNDGYFTMNDNWFDENVFEVVAPPEYLSTDAKKGLDSPVRVLPAWDPMCSSSVAGKRTSRRKRRQRRR